MKNIFCFLLFLCTHLCFAYSGKDCSRFISRGGGGAYSQIGWGAIKLITSSGQFVTSTGDCSMVGLQIEKRKFFVAFNHQEIKKNIAMGYGESLQAYLGMSGCPRNHSADISKLLKSHFKKIYVTATQSAEVTDSNIQVLIHHEYGMSCIQPMS